MPNPGSTSGPSITAITPDVAIEWGFNLYLADCSPGSRESRDSCQAFRSARRALQEFEDVLGRFRGCPRESLYVVKLRMAATSFARGISRRKEALANRLAAIQEEKQRRVQRIAQTERMGGIVRGGLQLLMLGGFSYALTRAVLALGWADVDTAVMAPEYASLATALGSALLGSFVKSWLMGRRILSVFRHYEEETRAAEAAYTRTVIQEYELAAQFAYNAWTQLTGEEPPLTQAFRNLLMSVMGGAQRTPHSERLQEVQRELRKDQRVMGGMA